MLGNLRYTTKPVPDSLKPRTIMIQTLATLFYSLSQWPDKPMGVARIMRYNTVQYRTVHCG